MRSVLVPLVASLLVVANIVAAKIVTFSAPLVGELSASAGVFPIAAVFLCTDILNERYGPRVARNTVWVSVAVMVVAWIVIQFAVWLPHDGGVSQSAFATTLTLSTPLFVASVLTVVVSQTLDVVVFHRLRSAFSGRYKWVRNLGSTAFSQLLDTSLFTVLAFMVLPILIGGTQLAIGVIGSIILVEYTVKIALAVIDTPLFYACTREDTEVQHGVGG
jgi:uncharacterized integral membrane protein (TIGR00697 family)